MAATFKVQVFKHVPGKRPWSNVYLLDAADLLDAVDQANSLIAPETNLHHDVVIYDRALVSSLTPLDGVFEVIPLATNGQIGLSGADWLPIYNTMRADFHVVGGGRPSRKYYRSPISEADQEDGVFTSDAYDTWQTRLQGFLTSVIGAGVNLVDPQGQTLDSVALIPEIQMRQEHRKRRRSTV